MKARDAGTLFAGARVDEGVPLAPLTTLRVGPVASRVITCVSTEQVVAALRYLDADIDHGPLLVLAGGSNVVIADTVAGLTVIRLAANNISVDGNVVRAEAGAVWDDVVVAAIGAGLGDWSACPASPARRALPRCRTSGPTAPRWPTPSPGYGYWTGAAARTAGCLPTSWASGIAPAC